MTSAEVAEMLGYTVQHVRRLLRNGTLTGMKIGRDWLVSAESVSDMILRSRNESLDLEPGQVH